LSGHGRPLNWDDIETCLRDLGDELMRRKVGRRTIVIVGGAFVAHRHLREATTDVDVAGGIDAAMTEAVAAVADRHGLEADWLNDRAKPWLPATFDPATCRAAFAHGDLEVLLPPVDTVVLMKIAAGGRSANDQRDLRGLWPDSSFATPTDAVASFYIAYPNEEPDPFLVSWLAGVVGAPGSARPGAGSPPGSTSHEGDPSAPTPRQRGVR